MDRYVAGLLDPFVTLLEVHKLMYFYAWGERKRQFSPQQIRLARRVLAKRGWIASVGA